MTRFFVTKTLYTKGLVIAMYLSKAITTTFMNDRNWVQDVPARHVDYQNIWTGSQSRSSEYCQNYENITKGGEKYQKHEKNKTK